jgi:hypothetical protein
LATGFSSLLVLRGTTLRAATYRAMTSCTMLVVAIAWLYVVGMMAVAEAVSSQGTLLGAFFVFVGYGVLPLSVLLYILNTPARKAALRRRESAAQQDAGGHAAGAPVAPEREEA